MLPSCGACVGKLGVAAAGLGLRSSCVHDFAVCVRSNQIDVVGGVPDEPYSCIYIVLHLADGDSVKVLPDRWCQVWGDPSAC